MSTVVLVCWGWLLAPVLGLAQDAAQEQYHDITAERTRAEADFAAQEQTCYARFAVQSCLDRVAAQRRVLERDLKGREAALNAAQRQQRAQEQLQRSAEKVRDRETPAPASPDNAAQRQQAQDEKQEAHRRLQQPSAPASKPLPAAPSAAEQAALRDAHAAKQRAALERRIARDKRLRDSKETRPALPLPQ
ncbi:MAG: hypothetical protein K2X79_03520 [Burkholderiaceae bacterium]|nr:hypothetical protein [Burkholderiaceae bacterium]